MKAQRLPQDRILHEVIENLQEIIWSKIGSAVKNLIKAFIENLLEDEITAIAGAQRYERSAKRKAYRNGRYYRNLLTKYGLIDAIRVPRVDHGGIEFNVFDRYERRRHDVDADIGRLFLNGISTRKLKGIAKQLYGQEVSAQTVSNTFSCLDKELERFKDKPIADTVEFLFLDGISQKVREIGIERKEMLCAFAIHCQKPGKEHRRKEIFSFQLSDVENIASWKGFLADLKDRGLFGKKLKLIVTDGNPALLKSIKSIYPFFKGQRCIDHKMRNVAVKIKKINRPHCLKEAKLIFASDNRKEAVKRFRTWESKWIVEEERAFREVRRRTRPMNKFFTNAASADRIMYGITEMLNDNWTGNTINLISTN